MRASIDSVAGENLAPLLRNAEAAPAKASGNEVQGVRVVRFFAPSHFKAVRTSLTTGFIVAQVPTKQSTGADSAMALRASGSTSRC